jgi:hypothetical protein
MVGLILYDVFQSVLVPRPVPRALRLSAFMTRVMWLAWRARALHIADPQRREGFLSTYAPFNLVTMLALWTGSLIVGYGFIFFGLRGGLQPSPDFGAAIYFAGASLLTIGYGDIVPHAGAARAIALVAGATGFATVAILTGYLFSLFTSFQARETFVLRFAAIAGSPASGIEVLETAAELDVRDDLPELFERGQQWSATVLETHLAYPMLAYFRSNHDYLSWIATLGALLDAATLLIATIPNEPHGQARLMYRVGRHLVDDLAAYFSLPRDESPGIDAKEFATVHQRLADAGYRVIGVEESWLEFSSLRAAYSTPLNTLAQFWRIPPAQWIGDRSKPKFSGHAPRGTA